MTVSRWEWKLPSGEDVAAVVNAAARTEGVFVGERLVCQTPRGARPEGHVVPLGGHRVTVTFDPGVLVCVLRVDGDEIAPVKWPVRPRAPRAVAPRTLSIPFVLAVFAGLAVAGLVYFVVSRPPAAGDADVMNGAHRAENGLFLARYPKSFDARQAPLPPGMSGVVLVDGLRKDAVVIVALPWPDSTHDAWLVHQRLHPEALATLPRGDAAYEEMSRHDGTCFGHPGAVVTARAKDTHGARITLVSCAIARGRAGYLALSSVREGEEGAIERAQRVIEATELTELGTMGQSATQ